MIVSNPDSVHCPYAVGDVITTASPTPPSERWPGTEWYQIKDCFLLAASDSHSAGSTGGEEYHVLTVDEIPAHSHSFATQNTEGYTETWPDWTFRANATQQQYTPNSSPGNTKNTGSNWGHNNMPPYKAYYMWERTK